MFKKILIANRGEIACRIIRTAQRLGIEAVAVYSAADRQAAHVKQGAQSFFIGPASPAESYLCGARIIEAARQCGAEAIHPGYGFLAENADFADLCARHNLTFIGPPAAAIRAMGSKSGAKNIMAAAGVAVLPGYHGAEQGDEVLAAAADDIGYPILIKAVFGGGGRGMRMVRSAGEFAVALAAVKRESTAAFGDERVLIEKYLAGARHIEVQVFADQHGHALHLFDRDCSIQRRRQKIIEEAPAPGLAAGLREKMRAAALLAVAAIDGYVGAATVEFLVDSAADSAADSDTDGSDFYFMEMNTRLQVEHSITEMIVGQDLVEWQLRAAAGLALPCEQGDLRIDGHAIEARICAEGPGPDFVPKGGVLTAWRPPHGAGLRVDSGVATGEHISAHYDSLLAKLIAHAPDRETARRRLRAALAAFDIAGVATNVGFLHAITAVDDFIAPNIDTAFLARNQAALFAAPALPPLVLACAALFEATACGARELSPWAVNPAADGEVLSSSPVNPTASGDIFSPWSPARPQATPWQLNLPSEARSLFAVESGALDYRIRFEGGQAFGNIDGALTPIALTPLAGRQFLFTHGEGEGEGEQQTHRIAMHQAANTIHINLGRRRWALAIAPPMRQSTPTAVSVTASTITTLAAPMPGVVVAIHSAEQTRVTRGAALLTLEAMKMEHTLNAPRDGVLERLFFEVGDSVREGEQLLTLRAN